MTEDASAFAYAVTESRNWLPDMWASNVSRFRVRPLTYTTSLSKDRGAGHYGGVQAEHGGVQAEIVAESRVPG